MDETTESVDEFLDHLEEWMDDLGKGMRKMIVRYEREHGEKISCDTCDLPAPGCCNQKTMVEFYEALMIARHVQRTGLDTPEFRAHLKQLGEEMEGTDRSTWFHAAHPCVFMKEGRCSIYRIRPLVCRLYYVTSPKENCQPGCHVGIRHINHGEVLGHALRQGMRVHKALGLKETPMRILMGTLPRMVWLALETLDHDDYRQLIHSQTWPTHQNLEDWTEGRNHWQPKEPLYNIRLPEKSG